jgi:hypothetical protein
VAHHTGALTLSWPRGVSLRLADGGLGRVEQVERAAALLVPGGAGLGQAQVAAGAVQQARAQRLLELRDMLARHGRRQAQPPGRGREAAGLHDFAEHAQAGHAVHRWFPMEK